MPRKNVLYVIPADIAKADRNELGYTREQLSALLGIGVSTIFLYERKGAPAWYRLAMAGVRLERVRELLRLGVEDMAHAKG